MNKGTIGKWAKKYSIYRKAIANCPLPIAYYFFIPLNYGFLPDPHLIINGAGFIIIKIN